MMIHKLSQRAKDLIDEYGMAAKNFKLSGRAKTELGDYILTREMRIEELEAENARLKEAMRWIPVSERLPEFNQDVTVIFYDGTISNGHFYESFDFVLKKNNGVYFDDRGRDPQIWHEAIAYWKYEDLPEVQK